MSHHAIDCLVEKRAQMQRLLEDKDVELKGYLQKIEYANNGISNTLQSIEKVRSVIVEITTELRDLCNRRDNYRAT